tara:strand:- start:266 stop:904 length:639 start_codon:yes stop_codon:yes gene_type:complete
MQLEYAEMMKWFRYNHPDKFDRWMDSLHPNQIKCKEWLVHDALPMVKIPRDSQNKFRVEIIGGWYGFPLIQYLVDRWTWLQIREIDIFEIDEFACKAIWKYCELFNYKKVRIFNQDYFTYKEKRRTHLVINTSCEHMWNMDIMKEYYEEPDRTLLALQSNDKTNEPDHINCVKTGQHLAAQADVKELYGDKMRFNEGTPDQYTRYMILGKWK